jgi:hypothetical protein
MPGFLDELDGIKKQAFLRDVGNTAKGWVVGGGENIGKAIGAYATPVESMRRGWKHTLHDTKSMGLPMKALWGVGLASGIRDVASEEDPQEKGRSRIHRALTFAGDQAGMIMSAPFGFWGGMAGSAIGSKVGDMAGRAVDKLRGYRPDLPPRPTGQQE